MSKSIMPYMTIEYMHKGEREIATCQNIRTDIHCHKHHIFYGTANRKLSEKYGLVVYLRPEQHNLSSLGVHFNKDFDNQLKESAQLVAMSRYGWSIDDFRKIFGRNYIND